jgi:hypothetical protein
MGGVTAYVTVTITRRGIMNRKRCVMPSWISKVCWNVPLWDMHYGLPKSVPVIMPDGRMQENVYRVVCQYSIDIKADQDILKGLRDGALATNKMVYPIAQTAEGYIVCAYEYDGTRFGMLVLNIAGLPVFESQTGIEEI